MTFRIQNFSTGKEVLADVNNKGLLYFCKSLPLVLSLCSKYHIVYTAKKLHKAVKDDFIIRSQDFILFRYDYFSYYYPNNVSNSQEEMTHLFLPQHVDIKHWRGPRPQMRYPHHILQTSRNGETTAIFQEQNEAHCSALSGRDTS